MSTPDWNAQAQEQVDGYVAACFPMLCESCKTTLKEDIAAALAAAYQQGREDERKRQERDNG